MKIENNIKVKGEITAKFYNQSRLNKWQKIFNKAILNLRNKMPSIMKYYILGNLDFCEEHKNVICNAGFNTFTKLLTGDTTYTGEINKAILGDGAGSAGAGDTQLINETYRNDIASGTDDNNIAYLTAFFTETEVQGSFTEFGNCIDGEVGVNTGQLWSHITGLNWVKDNTVVLVISCKYSFSSI